LPKTNEEVSAVSEDLGYKNLPLANQNAYTLFRGKKTSENQTGLKGRIGIYEVFEVTESIQELIMKRATSSQIQKLAQNQGMITMRQDGFLKALAGFTTIDEVNRVAAEELA
jgi:type IV pilus assembly protein PilB